MGIFRCRRTSDDEASSDASRGSARLHPDDRMKLDDLAQRMDLTRLRRWTHFWYCATESGAGVAAAEMREHGWRISRHGRAMDQAGWAIVADREAVVLTEAAVADARAFFTSLARRVEGGEYDGWEARVDASPSGAARWV